MFYCLKLCMILLKNMIFCLRLKPVLTRLAKYDILAKSKAKTHLCISTTLCAFDVMSIHDEEISKFIKGQGELMLEKQT